MRESLSSTRTELFSKLKMQIQEMKALMDETEASGESKHMQVSQQLKLDKVEGEVVDIAANVTELQRAVAEGADKLDKLNTGVKQLEDYVRAMTAVNDTNHLVRRREQSNATDHKAESRVAELASGMTAVAAASPVTAVTSRASESLSQLASAEATSGAHHDADKASTMTATDTSAQLESSRNLEKEKEKGAVSAAGQELVKTLSRPSSFTVPDNDAQAQAEDQADVNEVKGEGARVEDKTTEIYGSDWDEDEMSEVSDIDEDRPTGKNAPEDKLGKENIGVRGGLGVYDNHNEPVRGGNGLPLKELVFSDDDADDEPSAITRKGKASVEKQVSSLSPSPSPSPPRGTGVGGEEEQDKGRSNFYQLSPSSLLSSTESLPDMGD
ncbi:unnamed protein product [Chrysoparadoxa australica]